MVTSRWWRALIYAAAILVTGTLSGLAGAAVTLVVHAVQHLAYGYTQGPLLLGVTAASPERKLLGPMIGCTLAGLGWWLLRRQTTVPSLTGSIRAEPPSAPTTLIVDAAMQVVAVGSGASLGREQAPRALAAVSTDWLVRNTGLSFAQRRMLLGAAAGAGLAAVYNVPVAGVLFAVGLVLGTRDRHAVLVAAATCTLATVVSWPVTHGAPTFDWPPVTLQWSDPSVWGAIALAPVFALVGMGFRGLLTLATPTPPPHSWVLVPALGAAGVLTGAVSLWLPQVPGNGKSIVLDSLDTAGVPVLAAAAVVLVKPVVTALFLRAGAVGGLLTPALATGAATGTLLAVAFHRGGSHAEIAVWALAAAAAVLAVTQHAPLFAAAFAVELTHPPLLVWAVVVAAALGAHGTATGLRAGHRRIRARRHQ